MNRARLLRKKTTDAVRILWRHLRNRNFAGYKFRRQYPLDCYILDFYCPTAKLAIELDGGGTTIVSDKFGIERARNFWVARGIMVLRFWNHQIRQELDSVLQHDLVGAARAVLVQSLTLILSLCRKGRGEFFSASS